MSNGTENDWEALLAGRPPYQQKVLKHDDSSLTPEESGPFIEWAETEDFRLAYSASWLLLKQNPAKLRALRKREQRKMRELSRLVTDMALPKIPAGRPPKDSLVYEALQLKNAGHSYKQIAIRLKVTREDGSPNGERIRGLLKSRRLKARKAGSPPEKTQN